MPATAPFHRLRFGIRDVLWVTLVVGLMLGWWVDHRRLVAELAASGDVTGMVTVDGRPLAAGRILLSRRGGHFVGSRIENGRFQMPRVPVGPWSVAIEGDSVPPLYGSSSGMSVNIESRGNEFQFGLLGK